MVPDEPADSEVAELSGELPAKIMNSEEPAARSSQPYDDSEWQDLKVDLETEYNRLLPVVQAGLMSVITGPN
jgi:hypothetical protein